jgi:hypothetical protein
MSSQDIPPDETSATPAPVALPDQYRVCMNIRVGRPLHTHRAINGLTAVPWTILRQDSLSVLLEQVQVRLQPHNGYVWPEPKTLYLQPYKNTPQTRLTELCAENMEEQFATSFQFSSTRVRSQPAPTLQLWVYLNSSSPTTRTPANPATLRRSSAPRVAEAHRRITERLRDPEMASVAATVGQLSRTHWATTIARNPAADNNDFVVNPPTTNTFRQCNYLDREIQQLNNRDRDRATQHNSETATLTVEIYGHRLPITINKREWMAAFGLPSINLSGLGNFVEDPPTTINPEDDMDDIDHADD